MLTIPQILQVAEISQYLSANAIAKAGLFGGGEDKLLPQKMYNIRKSVSWLYDLDSDNDTLRKTANYLYALCAPYLLQAQVIINNGIPGTVAGGSGGIVTSPILITGGNFANATEWDGDNSDGLNVRASYTLHVFYNPASKFLNSTEFTRTASGFEIIIPGFDATGGNIADEFLVFISI